MMMLLRVLGLLALGLLFARCDSGGNSSDGKSSWLRECVDDLGCSAPLSCQCGVCSMACTSSEECVGLRAPSTCVEVSTGASGAACRIGVRSQSGLCLPGCRMDADCAARGALRCEAGVCVPGRRGAVEGGGASASAGGRAGGGAGSPDASSSGSAAGSSAALEGFRDAAIDPAFRAPRPGEAPPNPYGGPIAINDLSLPCAHSDAGNGSFAGAEYRPTLLPHPLCVAFYTCNLSCEKDADCPGAGSGSAAPVCNGGGRCVLPCPSGVRCAVGMTCIEEYGLGPRCNWSYDVTPVGCPAHCEQDPAPHDCPNWCGLVGVACDPSRGVRCCAGLRCGTGKFCEKGD